MPGKPKGNKSILSYFQPSSPPVPSSQTSALSFRDTSPPAPSSPLSYKATPVAKKAAPLEIGASDEEAGDEGFSDDSLEDLSALLGRERPGHTPPANQTSFSTPKAKRAAIGPFLSPFANKPKHKFDLKALAKDARRDNALNASSMKAKASADAATEPSSPLRGEAFDLAFTDIVKEKSGQDAHKVLRAVQRAEPIQSQPQYCFFTKDYRVLPSSPVPKFPRGRQSPEVVFTVRSVINRLGEEDFNITSQTDFAELKAMITILDIAVDDGSPPESNSPEDIQKFNEDIDELATKLREIWRKINDSGMKITRTEAKSVVEWVQQRLSNTVRTRKKAKQSIFDIPGQEDLASLPKQQEYMAKFFKKIPKPQAESD
ncbi:hypothetical protein TASIC1_0004014100 [Trichoderma asperellum]|uniref:Uncharacterized protein n=1 Tax=Trichoderma asperellum TaxID=101201 RepID=A0A6V8QPS2_TRIAP|nr:hypothetical protein TASIC1_0004014100 [Trichoderma asperellum]